MASVFLNAGYGVLLVAAAGYALTYILDMVPALSEFLPSRLTAGYGLLGGEYQTGDFTAAMFVTIALILINGVVAVIGFNKKKF